MYKRQPPARPAVPAPGHHQLRTIWREQYYLLTSRPEYGYSYTAERDPRHWEDELLTASSRALGNPDLAEQYASLRDEFLAIPLVPLDTAKLVLRERGDEIFDHGYMEDHLPSSSEEEESGEEEEEEGGTAAARQLFNDYIGGQIINEVITLE